MVQEFHVLRCFSCQSFQVQQVKKANRWICKLCGEKQMLLKEFGRGSGADCRRHVQKLNAMRGAMMEEEELNTWSQWKQEDEEPEEEHQVSQTQVSRWSKYLDKPEEAEPEEEEEEKVLMNRKQLHGDHKSKRKRRRDGWADSCTPEQLSQPGPMRPVRTSETTRTTSLNCTSPPSLNCTSPPSLNHTSLNHSSPPSLNHTSLNHTSPPSLNHTSLNHSSPPSLNHSSPPSLNHTSLNHSSPPSLNHTSPPSKEVVNNLSVGTSPVSRWARFLSSDCQVKEREEPVSGLSQSVGGAALSSRKGITSQTPPLTRPRPLLPVSSMFESGDEFTFDDFLSSGNF
uniref:MRN complex-interacting protein isoform X2 n=1 Tax=Semicossyphus pulcher TaxID=241346 RepID=UPI0037E870C5